MTDLKTGRRKMRIGVKYCGGCNPAYDRVALMEQVRERLKGEADFLPWQTKGIDLALIVCGCTTACADVRPFAGLRTLTISDPADVDALLRHQGFQRRKRDGEEL